MCNCVCTHVCVCVRSLPHDVKEEMSWRWYLARIFFFLRFCVYVCVCAYMRAIFFFSSHAAIRLCSKTKRSDARHKNKELEKELDDTRRKLEKTQVNLQHAQTQAEKAQSLAQGTMCESIGG